MNGINDGSINNFLTRRLNITDSPGPASTLAPEIMPVVAAVPPRIEDEFLRGVRLAATRGEIGALAANYSGFRLANPAGSRTLIVVEGVYVVASVAGQVIDCGLTDVVTALAGGTTATLSRDGRVAPTTTTIQTIGIATIGQAGAPIFTTNGKAGIRLTSPGGSMPVFPANCVVAPGQSFEVWSLTVNAGFTFTVMFYERRAQPSELG